MTCVFPPDTYRTTGSSSSPTNLPISTCAIGWFTAISGLPKDKERVLAVTAPILKQGPNPGPFVKEIKSISSGLMPDS